MKRIIAQLPRLQFIVRPSFWFGAYRVNMNWDKKLNELLDHHEATDGRDSTGDGVYVVVLQGIPVWVENFPYGFGRCNFPGANNCLPRRLTRLRLRKLALARWGMLGEQN